MSYQPLHHKYRPQTFADLVGQEAIASTLTNALSQQRIAPAYLFTGARGTGKTSSARILAKSLNCLRSQVPTAHPCGECEVCVSIANGSALDVIEIDAASNTGVDNIRELIERSQFSPVQCRYKVYVIDECHMLSTAAFNALLKTLEEPPDRVVFVLATTDPQRVLPTIISRCQRFDYRRIPLDAMVQHLRMIADVEQITITDEALTLVGQIAQGGLRDAESLLDQLSLMADGVTVDKVWEFVGAVPERDLMDLLQAIAADHPEALLDSSRRLMDRGREPLIVLQNLASFYRDLLIAKTAPTRSDLVALTPATWTKLCDFAQDFDVATILAGQTHLRGAEFQLKNTTQPRLWLEVTLMGLLPSAIARPTAVNSSSAMPARREIPAPRSVAAAIPAAAQLATSSTVPSTASAPVSPPPTVPVSAPVSLPTAVPVSTTSPPVTPRPPLPEPEPSLPLSAEPVAIAEPLPVPPQPVSAPAEVPAALNLDTLWQSMLKHLTPPSTQMLMGQQGGLLAVANSEVRVGIVAQWHPTMKSKVTNLEAAFAKALGYPVTVRLDVATPADFQAARGSLPVVSAPRSVPVTPASVAPSRTASPALDKPVPSLPRVSTPDILEEPKPEAAPHLHWMEDEVTQAAKQLAEFFAGKVVDVTDDISTSSSSIDLSRSDDFSEAAIDDDADDDMPF